MSRGEDSYIFYRFHDITSTRLGFSKDGSILKNRRGTSLLRFTFMDSDTFNSDHVKELYGW